MVKYNPDTMESVAGYVQELASNAVQMLMLVDSVGAIPPEPAGSAAEKAMSSKSAVVSMADDAIVLIQKELLTLSRNLEDSADAYRRGNIENIDLIREIWSDAGGIGSGYDYEGQHPELTGVRMPPRPPVTEGLGGLESQVPPSLLPEQALQVIRLFTSFPTDRYDLIREFLPEYTDLLEDPRGEPGDWQREAMGQYIPISKVGDGYRQLATLTDRVADEVEVAASVLQNGWQGPSGEVAGEYINFLARWLRTEASNHFFESIGAQYQETADSLYKQAARAAGAIGSWKDLVNNILDQLLDFKGLLPSDDILRVAIFPKRMMAKTHYLLIMTIMIDLVTMANDLGERWRLGSAVDNHALQGPRRVQ